MTSPKLTDGQILQSYLQDNEIDPEELMAKVGVSRNNIYSLYKTKRFQKRTLDTLKQVGINMQNLRVHYNTKRARELEKVSNELYAEIKVLQELRKLTINEILIEIKTYLKNN